MREGSTTTQKPTITGKKKDIFSWRYRKMDANNLTAADLAFLELHKVTAAQLGRFAEKVLTKEGTVRKS